MSHQRALVAEDPLIIIAAFNHRDCSAQILPLHYTRSPQDSPLSCQFYCLIDKQTTCMSYTSHLCLLDVRYQPTSSRHKAILDYLHNAGFTKSFEQLKQDTKLVRPISFLTGVDVPMRCIPDGLPARSRAEEQWPPRKEVDERDPDAEKGASSYTRSTPRQRL